MGHGLTDEDVDRTELALRLRNDLLDCARSQHVSHDGKSFATCLRNLLNKAVQFGFAASNRSDVGACICECLDEISAESDGGASDDGLKVLVRSCFDARLVVVHLQLCRQACRHIAREQ